MIVCSCENEEWEVETNQVISSYAEMFHEYGTFESWEEHTRTCDFCGSNFDAGFMVEGGMQYACEECFDHVVAAYDMVPEDEVEKVQDISGADGCWFVKEDGEYVDTGWFYTEWCE